MAESLSARNIVKRYGGVVALADGNLDIRTGEVVALIGANGSGKSTMSKVINGVVVLDGGQLLLDGKPVHFSSPQAAKNLGIATVFQELSLIPQMTVADNIWLTREPMGFAGRVDRKAVKEKTEKLLALFEGTYKTDLRPDVTVASLPADEKQIIEILKAVSFDPKMLILDEATASLDSRQVQRLFDLVGRWKQEGKAVVFVSHRMEEIFRIADRYSVLRNGKTVGAGNIKEINEKELVRLMIEAERLRSEVPAERRLRSRSEVPKKSAFSVARREPSASTSTNETNGANGGKAGTTCLEVEGLRTEVLRGIAFKVRESELVGIGGLQGQGQRDLLLALFGDIPFTGTVRYNGKAVHFRHPRQAMKSGFALVPGDRAREGLLYIRSILENLQLPSWGRYGFPLRMQKAKKDAEATGASLNLKMASLQEPVSSLSGGNAQKVVIGKWLMRQPGLLLLDDPTKGVDVGTKGEFYVLLSRLCGEGKTILFYSSDDDELVGLCDRVLVLHDGRIHTELCGEALTKENLIAASLGVTDGGAQ